MTRQVLTNFSKGELGPELYGRIDTPQYRAAAKRISNFIIQKYGGLAFRPGTRYVGPADGTVEEAQRYVPFEFGLEQSYVLPLWGSSMRALALGGMVLEEDDLEIQSVATGATTTLEIPYHQYAIGDRIYLDGNSGMTQLNGRFADVTAVPDGNHVTININSTGFDALTASTGITRVAPPPPPPPAPPPPPPPPAPEPPPYVGGGGGTYAERERPYHLQVY